MEKHIVKILSTEPVTHDVKRFRVEKPRGYTFIPGQATDLSINSSEVKDEMRPFTFTGLNSDDFLEFTIKRYDSHNGITKKLHGLREGDGLIIREVWGAISYNGPGVFIAGGAGVTPFIAIFRQLFKDNKINGNKLIFSNKTSKDIILQEEFKKMLGKNFINTLTHENNPSYESRRINAEFLKDKIDNFKQHFYICGPPKFVENISDALTGLGADPQEVVFEK